VTVYHQHAQKNKTAHQFDLFEAAAPERIEGDASPTVATNPLAGLVVQFEHDFCRCGTNVAIIGAGVNIHRASLRCRSCHRHRGWLSRHTANWIETIINLHGRPDKPITIRGPRL
jgi:hypothetical protein